MSAKIEISKSALGHADGLIQWAFVLNGAAAAGLLTFLGNAISKRTEFTHWNAFSDAIICFAFGLFLAVAARLCTFLALNFFADITNRTAGANLEDIRIYIVVGDKGTICAVAAFACFVSACIAFLVGVLFGRYAIFG